MSIEFIPYAGTILLSAFIGLLRTAHPTTHTSRSVQSYTSIPQHPRMITIWTCAVMTTISRRIFRPPLVRGGCRRSLHDGLIVMVGYHVGSRLTLQAPMRSKSAHVCLSQILRLHYFRRIISNGRPRLDRAVLVPHNVARRRPARGWKGKYVLSTGVIER